MAENFLSPELRLVQGDCFVGSDKNMQGQPHKDKAGNAITKWFIAAAGRKGDPLVEAFKQKIEAFARTAAPQFFGGPGGTCTHPQFSFKIVDGDGFDNTGKSNATKPGHAGHWVFKFGSNYAPRCFQAGKWTPAEQLQLVGGVNPIPRGDYIKVAGSLDFNGDPLKPGVYVNLGMVEWQRLGERIVTGPDAAAVFGGQGAAAPNAAPGYAPVAAPTPTYAGAVAGTPPPPPGIAPVAAVSYQAAPAYVAQGHTVDSLRAAGGGQTDAQLAAAGWLVVVAAPAPVHTPPPPPAPVAVVPHPGILAPAPAPLPPSGSAPPPPPPAPTAVAPGAPGFKMVDPNGTSYAAYIAAQWTDAMLVQNGLMVPL